MLLSCRTMPRIVYVYLLRENVILTRQMSKLFIEMYDSCTYSCTVEYYVCSGVLPATSFESKSTVSI
jgi:hypothetical protein